MGVIALNTIKTQIQTILSDANTTTGSPIDLSQNLSTNAGRVKQVLTVNPERIPLQASFCPYVTMFYDAKNIELKDIMKDMLTGRRMAEIDLKIVATVWNDDMNTANFSLKDLADNDCENLMENIEHLMRANPTINGNVLQCHATDVTYHSYPVSESAHMRAGIMNLKIKVLY